jgi:hypothetical protein
MGIGKKKSALETLLQLLEKVEQEEQKKLEQEIEKFAKKKNIASSIKDIAEFAGAIIGTASSVGGFIVSSASKKLGGGKKYERKIEELTNNAKKQINEKRKNIISAFPVPTSKEDILELLEYIYPQKNDILSNVLGNDILGNDKNVWEEKFRTILVYAKINFSNDKSFLAEISQYEKKDKQQQMKKKFIIAGIAVAVIAFGIWRYTNEQKDSEAKLQEKARLEKILDDVNLSIKNQDLNEAEYLTNQLVWKYESSWGDCKDEKKAWDKARKELITKIQKIKKGEDPNKKSFLEKIF